MAARLTRLRDGGTSFYARHGGGASLFGHMVRDARAAAGEMEAFERDAGTYKLAAGGAAVILLATTFLATQS